MIDAEEPMQMSVNLKEAANSLETYWSPKVIGELNGQYLKVAKAKGQLAWHKHDAEDELFIVLQGSLRIEYEDSVVELATGDAHIVPKGTLHNPVCDEECLFALLEPKSTQHTGDTVTERTVPVEHQLKGFGDGGRDPQKPSPGDPRKAGDQREAD